MNRRKKRPKRSPLRAKRRAYKREEIIAASIKVFAETGYASARMNDIAQELEATKGLLYHHFKSKEAILDAILNDEKLVAQLEAIEFPAEGIPLAQAVRSETEKWFAVMLSNPQLVRLLYQELMLPREKAEIAFTRFRERLYKRAERWLDHFKRSGEIRPRVDSRLWARLIVDAAINLFLQRQPGEDREGQPPPRVALLEILFNGVTTEPLLL